MDLDDNEVERAERFIPLQESAGELQLAATARAELGRLRTYLKLFVPRFDVCLLASHKDRQTLATAFPGGKFLQLPNVVRPAAPANAPRIPHRLLFVGSLHYFPNQDGIVHFCESILPLLGSESCSIRVVGAGATPRVASLARHPQVELAGFVQDLAPEYASARIAIVPLRAASGTRIKILEAIAHGCAVVSTTIGAEGLLLRHEEHCLIADTPEEFAGACRRLMHDDALRRRLVENAAAWLAGHHSIEQARAVLHALFP